MRPHSFAQSDLFSNLIESDGNWIPTKVEINSLVTLAVGRNGGHAKDSKKHGGNSRVNAINTCTIFRHPLRADLFFGHNFCVFGPNGSRFVGKVILTIIHLT